MGSADAALQQLDAAISSVDGAPFALPGKQQPSGAAGHAATQRTVVVEVAGVKWWAVTLVPPRVTVRSGCHSSSPPPPSGATVTAAAKKLPDLLSLFERRGEDGNSGAGRGAAAKALLPGGGVKIRGRTGLLRELGGVARESRRPPGVRRRSSDVKLNPGDFNAFWGSLSAEELSAIDDGSVSIDDAMEAWLTAKKDRKNVTGKAAAAGPALAEARREVETLRTELEEVKARLADQEAASAEAAARAAKHSTLPPASFTSTKPLRVFVAVVVTVMWALNAPVSALVTGAGVLYLAQAGLVALIDRGAGSGGAAGRTASVWLFSLRMILSYVAVQWEEGRMSSDGASPDEVAGLWDRNHDYWSKEMHSFIVRHKGLWVKAAQAASSRPEITPPAFVRELSKLQDCVPAMPVSTIRAVAEKAVGDVFESFDEKPLGSASIAQVHRAVLRSTGEVVAVKVRKPGVERSMFTDLRSLRKIWSLVYRINGRFDMRKVADMWDKTVRRELNFLLEAASMERVRRRLESAGVPVKVPRLLYPPSESCLIMEFIDGGRFDDRKLVPAGTEESSRLALVMCDAMTEQLLGEGLFNADQHMGNIMAVSERGKVVPVLLDFGNCEEISQEQREALSLLMVSLHRRDSCGVDQALQQLGLRLGGVLADPHRALLALRFMMRDVNPDLGESSVKRRAYLKWSRTERKERGKKLGKGYGRFTIEDVPDKLLPVFRMMMLLHGACASLGASTQLLRAVASRSEAVLRARYPHVDAPPTSTGRADLVQVVMPLVREMLEQGDVTGVQVHVERHGEELLSVAAGTLGDLDARSVTPATPFPLHLGSSSVVACALQHLASAGRLCLTDPIAAVWPAFGAAGKGQLTLMDALNHRCGLSSAVPPCLLPGLGAPHAPAVSSTPALQRFLEKAVSDGRVRPHAWTVGAIVDGTLAPQGLGGAKAAVAGMAAALGVEAEVAVGRPRGAECATLRSVLVPSDAHPPGSVDDAMGVGTEDAVDDIARHAGLDLSDIAQGREWMAEPRAVNLDGCQGVAGVGCFASARALARMHYHTSAAAAPEWVPRGGTGPRRRPPQQSPKAAAVPAPVSTDELGGRWRGGLRVVRVAGGSDAEALGCATLGGSAAVCFPMAGVSVAVTANTLTPGAPGVRGVIDAVANVLETGKVVWEE